MKRFLFLIFTLLIVTAFISKLAFNKEELLITNVSSSEFFNNTKSGILYNMTTKEIVFGKNIHQEMLPASTIKILTCITAILHLNINDYILIGDWINQVVGSKMYLSSGDYIDNLSLLYGLMMVSGNDAAMSLAKSYNEDENDFVKQMNKIVKYLDLKNTKINNPTGLDEESSNYTTCYDLAIITAFAYNNNLFKEVFNCKSKNISIPSNKTFYLRNKHRLIHSNPLVTGGKTGYTKKAGRTLVTTFNKNNNDYVIITFDAFGDWDIHQKIINHA